jgi:predicted RNA binding protein YcfA (HicA-like mRNA interferase family)
MLKVRKLRTMLREGGYRSRPGRGSHEVWVHPLQPRRRVVLTGCDGDEAKPYQVARVRKFRKGMMVYDDGRRKLRRK